VIDCGFIPDWDKPNTIFVIANKLVCVAFPTKHAALRSKTKDWLAKIRIICQEWSDSSDLPTIFSVS